MIRQIHSAGYDIPESDGHESNLMMVGPMLQTFLEDGPRTVRPGRASSSQTAILDESRNENARLALVYDLSSRRSYRGKLQLWNVPELELRFLSRGELG